MLPERVNRIENGMGKQLNFASLLTCALVSCIQPHYVIVDDLPWSKLFYPSRDRSRRI